MKVITVNTPDGQYHIGLDRVAEDRAEYYSKDGSEYEINSMEWKEQVDYVMNDDFEGIDWLVNNYDWEDWEALATKINSDVMTTDEDFWFDSENFKIDNV